MSLSESIAASLSGSAKLNEVTKLVKYLAEDLKDNNLSQTQREKFLETLKIYGRDPRDSDPIFTEEVSKFSRLAILFMERIGNQNFGWPCVQQFLTKCF